MTLKELIAELPEQNKMLLAIEFLEKLLPVWENFSADYRNLQYVDSVVGLTHNVDSQIVKRTMSFAKDWINGKIDKKLQAKLTEQYVDPIVSLQDLDWEIPENIRLIFYASYNLLGKINGEKETIFHEDQMYLVLNQAIDAILKSNLMTKEEIIEKIMQ